MANNEERLYGLSGWEHLEDEIEDVIEQVVDDNCQRVGEPWDVIAASIQWPIRVGVYRRMKLPPSERLARWALGGVLEPLDCEYGDPEGDATTPSEAMKAAALALANIILAEYHVWVCEPTGEIVEITEEQAREMTEGDQPQ